MREILRTLWTPDTADLFPEPMRTQFLMAHRFNLAMAIGFLLLVPPGLVLLALAFVRGWSP